MARDDWFRNTDWNPGIEAAFNAKLDRARKKDQYLRIQAYSLIETHPEITLELIERYFLLGEHFFDAAAFVDRAKALVRLKRLDEAFDAYESALKRESESPNFRTNAYVDFPFLVATKKAKGRYERALDVLRLWGKDLAFPINKFRWNVAYALICLELGRMEEARKHAEAAIEASAIKRSEFQKHRGLGLVGEKDATWMLEMEAILQGKTKRKRFGFF